MIQPGPTYELYVDYFQTSRLGFKKFIFIPCALLNCQNRLVETHTGEYNVHKYSQQESIQCTL